jgi:hypothetical protein
MAQIRKLRVWLESAPPVHYINGVFDITAHYEEVEVVLCLHQQGMVFGHLLA